VPEGVVYVNFTTVCAAEFCRVVILVATVPVCMILTFPPEISSFVIATVGLDGSAGLKLYLVSVSGVDMIVPACPVYVVPEGVVYVNFTIVCAAEFCSEVTVVAGVVNVVAVFWVAVVSNVSSEVAGTAVMK